MLLARATFAVLCCCVQPAFPEVCVQPPASASSAALLQVQKGETTNLSDDSDHEAAEPPADSKPFVQVFAAERPAAPSFTQMQLMLTHWLLNGSGQLPALGGGGGDALELRVQPIPYSHAGVRQAFRQAAASRPFFTLWLFPFKDGDTEALLPQLAKHFALSASMGLRHGVFHWTPELCNHAGTSPEVVTTAYEHVEFVFMFGYLDDRLAMQNKSKYLPFPLGPALWRGWWTPATVLATKDQTRLASFRGSSNTHSEIDTIRQSVEAMNSSMQSMIFVESRGAWTGADTADDKDRFRALLATSKFALAPPGQNPNTYRLSEAVESGAMPVLVARTDADDCNKHWAGLYGLNSPESVQYDWIPCAPFVVLPSWANLGAYLQTRTDATEDMTPRLHAWYEKWRAAFLHQLVSYIRQERVTEK